VCKKIIIALIQIYTAKWLLKQTQGDRLFHSPRPRIEISG
jgi:hypothetical protein